MSKVISFILLCAIIVAFTGCVFTLTLSGFEKKGDELSIAELDVNVNNKEIEENEK